MSQQNIPQRSIQINASVAAQTLFSDQSGQPVPADIKALILSNTSATPTLVTLSDGINNYYYSVPANNTIQDYDILADRNSTGWTITCGTSVNSLYVTATFN